MMSTFTLHRNPVSPMCSFNFLKLFYSLKSNMFLCIFQLVRKKEETHPPMSPSVKISQSSQRPISLPNSSEVSPHILWLHYSVFKLVTVSFQDQQLMHSWELSFAPSTPVAMDTHHGSPPYFQDTTCIPIWSLLAPNLNFYKWCSSFLFRNSRHHTTPLREGTTEPPSSHQTLKLPLPISPYFYLD